MVVANRVQRHPFPATVEAGDLDGIVDALAPDAVLISPITSRFHFEGRNQLRELFSEVLETLEDFKVLDQFGRGDRLAVVWQARVRGQQIEGTDILLLDDAGKVREIRLFIRPLPGLAALTAALASRLARQHSRSRAATVSLLVDPLAFMTRSGDGIVARLAKPPH
jgi:hypothetical protein